MLFVEQTMFLSIIQKHAITKLLLRQKYLLLISVILTQKKQTKTNAMKFVINEITKSVNSVRQNLVDSFHYYTDFVYKCPVL